MISVLVYGRNDERGYGMHKRVALSLNAMAHVLSAPTSEIIFVDYNTLDHLPTLPELIRDTLTDTARERLRVLRVRPKIHHRYADLTPLPVLEPIARNIGLRRTRQQNRWCLSTNTDAIIVPLRANSLCEIVSALPQTHYGLPRFELPERAWEGFDRLDPRNAIEAAAEWGRFGRLNETVRGEGAVQFDGPGDFQLVRRAELFAIDGFDEEALLGWHVDHNLAQRLRLRFGDEGDLSSAVQLYHCGHARKATNTHSADRIENDVARFVDSVVDAELYHQRDNWGHPDLEIEEIDLTENPQKALRSALKAIMPPLVDAPLVTNFDRASFDCFWYDPGHVATHVLDLLSTYSRDTVFAFVGCRPTFCRMLAAGIAKLGFHKQLLVPFQRLAEVDSEPNRGTWSEVLETADVFIFEFGLARHENLSATAQINTEQKTSQVTHLQLTAEELIATEQVASAFRECVDHQRRSIQAGERGRLLVTINALNTRYDLMVKTALQSTPSPFTTRLCYGEVQVPLEERLLAPNRPSPTEISAAKGCLRELANAYPAGKKLEIAALGGLLRNLIQSEELATAFDITSDEMLRRLEDVQSPPPDVAGMALAESFVPSRRAFCTLARLCDWDNPEWVATARRVIHSGARGATPRNSWVWERAQILYGLSKLSKSGGQSRALVVLEHPDTILASMEHLYTRLDVLDVRSLAPGAESEMRTLTEFGGGSFLSPSKFKVFRRHSDDSKGYDAIILPHASAFHKSMTGVVEIIGALRPLLADAGLFVLAGEVAVFGRARNVRPDPPMASSGLPKLLASSAGLQVAGDVDMSFHRYDAALIGTDNDLHSGRPVLGVRRNDDIFWPAVWFFEASKYSKSNVAESLMDGMLDLLLGEQIAALRIGPAGQRDGDAISSVHSSGEGHVFFGPFLSLSAGRYRVTVDVESEGRPSLVLEACEGPNILVQESITAAPGIETKLNLNFEITRTRSASQLSEPCEVRLWTSGEGSVRVTSVRLERAT